MAEHDVNSESFDGRPPGKFDACVVGGAGHIGLPLAILLAHSGLRTVLYDLNVHSLAKISRGVVPFHEAGAEPLLREALARDLLACSTSPASVFGVSTLIVTIGTPIDEFHNPVFRLITDCFAPMLPYL